MAQEILDEPDRRVSLTTNAIELLNTFELLANLVVESKSLPLGDAWINFSPWVIRWWDVLRPGIEREQEEDTTVYEDLAELVNRFFDEEARRRGLPREGMEGSTEAGRREFLQSEAAPGKRPPKRLLRRPGARA